MPKAISWWATTAMKRAQASVERLDQRLAAQRFDEILRYEYGRRGLDAHEAGESAAERRLRKALVAVAAGDPQWALMRPLWHSLRKARTVRMRLRSEERRVGEEWRTRWSPVCS